MRHFLVGSNGQGKTNLLEAAGFITALRSFRSTETRQLIAHGQPEAGVVYHVEHEQFAETSVTLKLTPQGKELLFDQEKVTKLADFIGKFPTVVFSSQDHQLIRGSPNLRRKFLDLVLAATDADYLRTLQTYHRALADRNRLLRDGADLDQIVAFETLLAPAAATLAEKRTAGLDALTPRVERAYAQISEQAEPVTLRYAPDLNERDSAAIAAVFAKNRARDAIVKTTQAGPHRDDFDLLMKGRDAKDFASEGQQRSLVIALRLAQVAYFEEKLGIKPVLLADDVLGELDPGRRERFWGAVDPQLQVLATGTVLPEGERASDWQVFHVNAGAFAPAEVRT